jgi:hypothetical protein
MSIFCWRAECGPATANQLTPLIADGRNQYAQRAEIALGAQL